MDESKIKLEAKRQFDLLTKGCEEIINKEDLLKKLENSLRNNKPLKVKFGIDPTGSDLHIGHSVNILKLKQFQDLGHEAILVIGTFTGKIGDPTGKSETRKMLSDEDVQNNLKTYLEQIKDIIDVEKLTIVKNHEWFEKMSVSEFLNLLSKFTVSQMVSREDFSKRLKENKPVSLIEFSYPILQGYDSVALKADVELGATEQKFNILRGRDLLKEFGYEPQVCMLLPILVGLDGVQKMSKSLNNYIAIKENPNDMFGKIMSISDELMYVYYNQLTDLSPEEIENIKQNVHPMTAKKDLASLIVKNYINEEEAIKAREYFEQVFSNRNTNIELPIFEVNKDRQNAIEFIVNDLKALKSNSEARRLISQGGFKIDDVAITDLTYEIEFKNDMVIRVGKKNIIKIKK